MAAALYRGTTGPDKENVAPAVPLATRRKGLGSSSSTTATPTTSSSSANVAAVEEEEDPAAVPDLTLKRIPSESLPRLLLFTEKADEVFLLGDSLPDTEARRKLATAVVEDRGNPLVWWQLLQHVHQVFGEAGTCDLAHAGPIRKLYQKATRIIPDGLDKEDPSLVNIWLGFAAAEGRVSESDAREAYAHMNRCGIGARSATFYLRYAAFEEKHQRAKEAINLLQTGITRGAAPLEALLVALDKLRAGTSSPLPLAAAPPLPSSLPSTPTIGGARGGDGGESGSSVEAAAPTASVKKPPPPKAAAPSPAAQAVERQPLAPPPPPSAAQASLRSSLEHVGTGAAEPPLSSQKEGKQQPRPAAKTKRLLPTGRLLGLGKAERVRFDTPGKSTGDPEAKDGEDGDTSSSVAPAAAAAVPAPSAPTSSTSTPASKPAAPDATIPPPPLTGLQPIDEDEVTAGAGGKGSDDTVGSQKPMPQQTTGEICFRVQTAKTPLASGRGGAVVVSTPSSVSRPPPPPSSCGRPKSAEPAHDEDLTHTRDRGRAGGEKKREEEPRRGSLEDDEAPVRTAAPQQHSSRPHTGSVTKATSSHHHHHQQEAPQPLPHQQQQPPPPAQQHQQFSFDTLLASRNFMTLNNTQYLRLDVLGRGGSSKVFRVLSDTGHIYALKRVRVPPKDGKALESFANEITLLARLRGHPCIIQLVDSSVDRATGLVLMLMELGEIDLSKLLAQQAAAEGGEGGRLSLNFVRFVWEQMLRAVHCVHEERIVHGDLKPANFVFVRGRIKLIDFGIAKAIGNDTTNIMRESQVGTVNYMSPEAILDTGNGREQPGAGGRRAPCMKIGRASDVWSLGCILYQLVYGKTPFADLNLIQKLHCIVDENHRIAFPYDVHPDVADTIRQCLRRDPTTRPPIAGGPTSLLQHPFLNSTATAAGGEATVRRTIAQTLAAVDQDPTLLQGKEGEAQRANAVYERVLRNDTA